MPDNKSRFSSLLFLMLPIVFTQARANDPVLDNITTDCVIEPSKMVDVSSSISGVLDSIEVTRGDEVSEGQVLAKLESRVEQATVELARAQAERDQLIKAKKAQADFTKRRLERNQELFEKNMVSAQIVDEAETEAILAEMELGEAIEQRQIAELELKRAMASLSMRTIKSPVDGIVVQIYAQEGESIEDRPIIQIARIDPLNVEVIAPITLLGKIRKGMQAEVIPEDPVGGSYIAKVKIVDPVVDAASGTFGIRLELPNPEHALPAGLGCDIHFKED